MTRPVRRHDIDALRVIAFGLLILYHVGMFYVAEWSWHVKSAWLSETLQLPMLLVNPWRMPLLFLISGLAVNFLLRKHTAGSFARSRTKRLLIPLLFGMAVIVPPQAWLQAVSNGAFEGGYLDFLWRYFTFQPWPDNAFDGSDPGITWNHLWYLPYLLTYSLALAAALPLLRSPTAQRVVEGLHRLRSWRVFVLPVLPFLIYAWTLRGRFPETHALLDDWYNHAVYFTLFLLGFALGAREGLWAELRRLRKPAIALALVSYTGLVVMNGNWPESALAWQYAAGRALICFNSWFWLVAVLGWGHHLLNRPFRWLNYANEAVYPWYVLHQTITVVAGFYLSKLALGPVLEPALVLGITVGGCLVLHEFLIRRSAILRPLFGLKPRPMRKDARHDARLAEQLHG